MESDKMYYDYGIKNFNILSEQKLYSYLYKHKLGDKNARELLIKHNIKLVIFIVNRYKNMCDGINIEYEDLIMVGIEGLIKGIDKFDLNKGVKLSTYIGKCITNEILIYLKKNRKYKNNISLNEVINIDENGNSLKIEDLYLGLIPNISDEYIKYTELLVVRKLVNSLNKCDKEIIKLYYGFYGKCYSQEEIATVMNFSQSYTSRKIRNTSEKIKIKLLKENIYYY